MRRLSTALLIILLTIILATPSLAAELADVMLPDTQTVAGTPLVLNGIALRGKFVFDVYVAGLYLAEKSSDPEAILDKDAPRMMVMHFLREVSAKSINKAWLEGLADNTPAATPVLKDKFKQLTGMMTDITDGQAMVFTYAPATGTEIVVGGRSQGFIEGKDFADAMLATWIGPKTGPGEKFKNALLGK